MPHDLVPLSPSDRVFAIFSDLYPCRPMICALGLVLDRAPDREALQALVDGWVAEHPRLTWALHDRLRWRVARAPPIAEEALDGAVDVETLLRATPALTAGGPRWGLTIVHGRDSWGLRLVWDHALSDGEGVLRLVAGSAPPALPATPPAQGALRWLMRLWTERSPHPPLRLEHPTDDLSFRVVRTGLTSPARPELIARSVHAVHGGLDRPMTVRVMAPSFSVRDPAAPLELGNDRRRFTRTVLAPGSLPALVEEAAAQGQVARATPYAALRAMVWLPERMVDRVLRAVAPVIVNQDAGGLSDRVHTLAGAEVVDLAFRPPLLPYQGCTFVWWTFRGVVRCSITTDRALVEDVDGLAERLVASSSAETDRPRR